MEIREGRKIIHEDMALNDIVLHAGKSVHMIDFQMKLMDMTFIDSIVMA